MPEFITELPAPDLTGRILSLNLQHCRKFQCGGFFVSTNRPMAVVESGAQQDRLREALIDGRLVDVTDQNKTGLTQGDTGHTAPQEAAEKGNRVYIQVDGTGNVLIVAPKDEQDEASMEAEILAKGSLTVENYSVADKPLGVGPQFDPNQAGSLMDDIGNRVDDLKSKHQRIPRMK